MHVSLSQLIVWLIIGALAGSLVGSLVQRNKRGFGAAANLAIGLIGALIGGFLFKILRINLGLGSIAVSLEDLLAAVIGAFFFLFVVWIIRR